MRYVIIVISMFAILSSCASPRPNFVQPDQYQVKPIDLYSTVSLNNKLEYKSGVASFNLQHSDLFRQGNELLALVIFPDNHKITIEYYIDCIDGRSYTIKISYANSSLLTLTTSCCARQVMIVAKNSLVPLLIYRPWMIEGTWLIEGSWPVITHPYRRSRNV